jgi:hypothetical protein
MTYEVGLGSHTVSKQHQTDQAVVQLANQNKLKITAEKRHQERFDNGVILVGSSV